MLINLKQADGKFMCDSSLDLRERQQGHFFAGAKESEGMVVVC